MTCPRRESNGFTLIEILVVLAFVGILSLSFPTFKAFNQRQAIQLSAKQLKTDLREAQSRSLGGSKVNDAQAVWGIRFLQNSSTYQQFSCPADVSLVSEYNWTDCSLSAKEKSLKNKVAVTSITDFPAVGGFSVIFLSAGEVPVIFREDDGDSIQNDGVDVDSVAIKLNIPGLEAEEERLVRISQQGNVEDLKL